MRFLRWALLLVGAGTLLDQLQALWQPYDVDTRSLFIGIIFILIGAILTGYSNLKSATDDTDLNCWYDFGDGNTCVRPANHNGRHKRTPDSEIIIGLSDDGRRTPGKFGGDFDE